MRYDYICERCEEIWEISHGMMEEPIIVCAKCEKSDKVIKYVGNWGGTAYIRGYGWMDKAGARRDMDHYQMTRKGDPYGEHREPGEATDIVTRLEKGGRDPNTNTGKSRLMYDKNGNSHWIPISKIAEFKKENEVEVVEDEAK